MNSYGRICFSMLEKSSKKQHLNAVHGQNLWNGITIRPDIS
jgi:hypothetical protein